MRVYPAPAAFFALVLACLVGALFAQTFQYSRGWTNGKKRAQGQPPPPARDAACQLQKLRNILAGRSTPQLYWPCEWQQPTGSLDYDSRHGGGSPAMVQPPPLMDMDNI